MGNVQVFQLGAVRMDVRTLDRGALDGLPDRFDVLLPAVDLVRLPATLDVLVPLLQAGCAGVILAGPRAEAYRGQVSRTIAQQGADAEMTAYEGLSDACNAALLGALIHKAGVALVADEPAILDELRGVAEMNGWTAAQAPAAAVAAPLPAKQAGMQPGPKPPAKKAAVKKPPAKKAAAKKAPAKKVAKKKR